MWTRHILDEKGRKTSINAVFSQIVDDDFAYVKNNVYGEKSAKTPIPYYLRRLVRNGG